MNMQLDASEQGQTFGAPQAINELNGQILLYVDEWFHGFLLMHPYFTGSTNIYIDVSPSVIQIANLKQDNIWL